MPTRRTVLRHALGGLAALPLLALRAQAQATDHAVEIRGNAFSPPRLTIAAGDSVVFSNRDLAPHTVTADDGGFDSGRFGLGGSVRMTFPSAGTYPYHCEVHPRMRATIIVG